MGLMVEYKRYSKRITSSRRWQVLRVQILERDGFACVDCGNTLARLEVDHIKPVRTHPELAYDPANLATRCSHCHTRKTRIECGHPAPSEDRLDWRDAVADLQRGTPKPPKGTSNA